MYIKQSTYSRFWVSEEGQTASRCIKNTLDSRPKSLMASVKANVPQLTGSRVIGTLERKTMS